jgi:integrase
MGNMSENAQNLILRYDYRIHLQEAQGADVKTVDAVMRAIAEFEAFVDDKDFAKLTTEEVIGFKRHIASRQRRQGDSTLSLSSVLHILHHLKGFFTWLRTREGYRRMDPDVPAFFSPPRRDEMSARSPMPRLGPSLQTVEQIILRMLRNTPAERRNRAAIALILVTGVRDGALVSLRRKHLQFERRQLIQDGREVSTKFGRSHVTWFFPISELAETALSEWVTEIDALGFAGNDPLFPREVDQIRHQGRGGEITRVPWASAAPLRASLREACANAGVPYFFPHAIRKTIAVIGEQRALTPIELKAWSQNLGHRSVRTTLDNYGTLRDDQVAETIQAVGRRSEIRDLVAMLESANHEKQRIIRSILEMRG